MKFAVKQRSILGPHGTRVSSQNLSEGLVKEPHKDQTQSRFAFKQTQEPPRTSWDQGLLAESK